MFVYRCVVYICVYIYVCVYVYGCLFKHILPVQVDIVFVDRGISAYSHFVCMCICMCVLHVIYDVCMTLYYVYEH